MVYYRKYWIGNGLFLSPTHSKEGFMAEYDVVIKGGTIVDGTRVPRYRADIGIKNGKIAKIGRLNGSDGKEVLDASGMIVAPGAIDLHTHYDAQLHWDPYLTIGSWHGVTSVTIGNCGFGFAPVHAKDAERAMLAMTRNEAIPYEPMKVSMAFNWETFPQYLDCIDRLPLGVNLSHLVPVTPLVAYVMGGFDDAKKRLPNEKEMGEIVRLFHEAMDAGAAGWSAQRLFPEGDVSVQRDYDGSPMISDILSDEFYVTMAKALGERGEGCVEFTQVSASLHYPDRGPQYDFNFNARIAEESGRPVLYNAVAVNDKFPDMYRSQLKWLADANAKGTRVFGQAATVRIPFTLTFEDWNLFDNSNLWREATLGTVEEKKVKLANPDLRKKMREEFDSGAVPIDAFGHLSDYIAKKVYRSDLEEKYEGLSVAQIAEKENKHLIDAMLDLTVADDLKTQWRSPIVNTKIEFNKELMESPYTVAGVSDGGAHMKFITAGIWPTDLLSWMVRDTGALSLEEAHFRMSGMSAWAAGLKDRGCIREGLAADIIVYDLDKLNAGPVEIVSDLPTGDWRRVQKAEGYRWIMVNGQTIFENGECTGATPGKLLRSGQAR
jgi:N-acyl-D-aspartate/D-glutamate deacylase